MVFKGRMSTSGAETATNRSLLFTVCSEDSAWTGGWTLSGPCCLRQLTSGEIGVADGGVMIERNVFAVIEL
jgi:hypothetical protein